MSLADYLILGLLAPVVVYVVASLGLTLLFSRPRPPRSRWRRFRISPEALYQGRRGTAVVQEEVSRFQLRIIDGNGSHLPLRLGDSAGKVSVRVDRRLLAMRTTLDVRLRGRPWLALRLRPRRGFPELEPTDRPTAKGVEASVAAGALKLQGNLAAREYEVRAGGRLIASVSWQHGEKRSEAVDQYYVEVVRSSPALPLLALALALEVAARLDGVPATVEEETKN